MRRRRLLAATATACGLAGCLARQNGTSPNGADPNGSMDGNEPTPTIEDSEISPTGSQCASGDVDDATVERDDDGVTVAGSLETPTPCYDPVLASVGIEEDELRVQVDASEQEGFCQQCIGEVGYEARIDVANADALVGARVEHVDGGTHSADWSDGA